MAIDQKPPLPNFGPKNPQQPLDLEKIFNEERIDLKALMDSRKLTKEINKTLAPYTGEFGDAQKKHLLKRTMVGYASRHLKDLEGLTMEQAVDKIMTPHEIGEPVNNYYFELSAEEYKEKYGNDDVGPLQLYVGGSDRNVSLSVTSLKGSTVYSTDLSVGSCDRPFTFKQRSVHCIFGISNHKHIA